MRPNFNQKLMQFFMGRNGVDMMAKFFLYLSIILMIVTMFSHSTIIYLLATACIFYTLFRMTSKNVTKRQYENQVFMNKTFSIRSSFSKAFYKIKRFFTKHYFKIKTYFSPASKQERKTYKVFKCPKCKQKLRAPRGRGKIEVTCSKCKHVFIKRV